MWQCPKCRSSVDDSFEVCWSCGTTPEGIVDPNFVTADDAAPIPDEEVPKGTDVDDPLADFAGTPLPDLVACYTASDAAEAKFIADELMEQGIPAIPDKLDIDSLVGMCGSGVCERTTFFEPKAGSKGTSTGVTRSRLIWIERPEHPA
jgi:hypothetical protein